MEAPKTVSDAYPGYIEAGDLDGRERDLTIDHVRSAGSKDKGRDGRAIDKPILVFDKPGKNELVLCKTNARTIRALYGNAFAKWCGRKVRLYPTTCDAFGVKNTPCIRVRFINPDTGKAPAL